MEVITHLFGACGHGIHGHPTIASLLLLFISGGLVGIGMNCKFIIYTIKRKFGFK